MKRKQTIVMTVVILLTIIQLLLSVFYLPIYGYFNRIDHLSLFTTLALAYRVITCAVIAIAGYLNMRLSQQKFMFLYLALLVVNLLAMNILG